MLYTLYTGSAVREVSKKGGRGWTRGKCQVVLGVEECRSAETGAVERLAGLRRG